MEDFNEQIHQLRTGAKLPENRNDYWSTEDTKKLTDLFGHDVGISQIAVMLGRTEVSVACRLLSMGLFQPQTRPRGPNKKKDRDISCKCPDCSCTDCPNHGKCQLPV